MNFEVCSDLPALCSAKRNTQLVVIPDEWKEKFLARIETWEEEGSKIKHGQLERLRAELETLKAKINRLNDGFVNNSIDIQEFKEIKNRLVPKRVQLEQQIRAVEQSKASSRLEPLKKLILEANEAEKWASNENWLEMKSFLKKIGSNRLLRAQTLTVAFKEPANLLAENTVAVRSTDDVSQQSSKWWRRGELNPRP